MKVVNFRQRSTGEFLLVDEDRDVIRFVSGEREQGRLEPANRVDGYSRSVAAGRRVAGVGAGSGRAVSSALRVSAAVQELDSIGSVNGGRRLAPVLF